MIIKRDKSFLDSLIPKLDLFFFMFYLPNICNSDIVT